MRAGSARAARVLPALLLAIAPTSVSQEVAATQPASALPRMLVVHGPLEVLSFQPGPLEGQAARRLRWGAHGDSGGGSDLGWIGSGAAPGAVGSLCQHASGCSKRAIFGPSKGSSGGTLRMFCAEHRTVQASFDLNRKRCKHAEGCDNFAYYGAASPARAPWPGPSSRSQHFSIKLITTPAGETSKSANFV
jgi:hypothetical protein